MKTSKTALVLLSLLSISCGDTVVNYYQTESDSGILTSDSGTTSYEDTFNIPQTDSGLPQTDSEIVNPDSGLPQTDSGITADDTLTSEPDLGCTVVCDDGDPCTDNVCKGSTCEYPVIADKCLIDGKCLDKGTIGPRAGRIEPVVIWGVCDPSKDTRDWTVAEEIGCRDAYYCTYMKCNGVGKDCIDECIKNGNGTARLLLTAHVDCMKIKCPECNGPWDPSSKCRQCRDNLDNRDECKSTYTKCYFHTK